MTALIITRGLPASGKTTVARQWVSEDCNHRVRVNRDDLRMAMYGRPAPLPHQHEEAITVAQRAQVTALLRAGQSVVVDDMHLRAKYGRAWADLAQQLGVDFGVVDLATDVDECVRRDHQRFLDRKPFVGEQVIRDLADRFRDRPDIRPTPSAPAFPLYVPEPGLPHAWIVDVDGTLALRGDHDGVRAWYGEEDRVGEDSLHTPVADLVRALDRSLSYIVVMSGRTDACRAETIAWLKKHRIPWDLLVMRPAGDHRKDYVVKHELLMKYVAPLYAVQGCIDDRSSVVRMWRQIGLTCAQVAEGDF